MNRKVDLVTIHKYLSGQLSDPDVARFEDEMSKDEALRTAVEDVRSALAAAGEYQTPAWNVDDALSSMPFAPSNAVVSRTDNNKRIRMRAWVASAAAVALLLVAGLMIVRSYVTTEILTYEGTAALELSDKSMIYLNNGSSLVYPEEFDDEMRHVVLDGEGYFDIARDEQREFVIATDLGSVTVLGTSFNVREDEKSGTLEVVVSEGRVRVSPANSNSYEELTAGESVIFDSKNLSVSRTDQDDLNGIAWHTRQLKWRDTDIADVVEDMEALFSISIDMSAVTTELGCGVTSNYRDVVASDLPGILSDIEQILNISTVQTGEGTYRMAGGACQ